MAKKRKKRKQESEAQKRQRRAKAAQRRSAGAPASDGPPARSDASAAQRRRNANIRELERAIEELQRGFPDVGPADDDLPSDVEAHIVYCIDRPDGFLTGDSVWRRVDAGEPGGPPDVVREEELPEGYVDSLLDDVDRAIEPFLSKGAFGRSRFLSLCHARFREVLPRLIETGRFFRHHADGKGRDVLTPWVLQSSPGPLRVTASRVGRAEDYAVECRYGEGETSLDAAVFRKVFHNGYGYDGTAITDLGGPLSDGVLALLGQCRGKSAHGARELGRLLGALTEDELDQLVVLEHVDGWREEEIRPVPVLRLSRHGVWPPQQRMRADVVFRYDDVEVDAFEAGSALIDVAEGLRIRRMPGVEKSFLAELREQRCILPDSFGEGRMAVTAKLVPILPRLIEQGWQTESLGKPVRTHDRVHCRVRSGVDWFDLHAAVVFGGQTVDLAAAIAGLKAGERMLQLSDGSFAMLPVETLERLAVLWDVGEAGPDGALRLPRSQAVLLDALLATQEVEFSADAALARVRRVLRRHAELTEADAPEHFRGTLRGYQRGGLAWLLYLRDAGFGGCLADDMGLGKTVQVLALLEHARSTRKRHRPSLAVVPRSVLTNWQREAERFTPCLRTHIHHGAARSLTRKDLRSIDLVLTTYATLRNDAAQLGGFLFDTCILDEAQAVKNPDTQAAKAARLIEADHRLALTGTPIENHLGDLWSIFEFLNPGMLGTGPRFRRLIDDPRATPDSATLQLIAQAVRPFLLRRTKGQVLSELPEKTEVTLYCELEGRQREEYDTRLAVVRAELLGLVRAQGLNRSKFRVIEALLRLRQCACHAGLVACELSGVRSAKLELLLEQLREVTEEGHKALVFSQFTSFLAYARRMLDEAGIPYEYLDGRTRKRQERVDRFQDDPDCRVFLISLKAGGLGLNLTAASYVYILDPWWNPAVETQAVDRTHRIGQTRKVFAYRLIARDTVEEKVLQLQQRKRDLAEAILTADKSVMKKLDLDDLHVLLS